MKKVALVVLAAAMFLGVGIQNASAENSLSAGKMSFGVTTSSDTLLMGKYMVMNDVAVLVGLGVGVHGGDDKGTDITFHGGARKYFKVADFAPFAGAALEYATTQDSNVTDFAIFAEGGAEYFLAKHFSLEGAVRLGYVNDKIKGGGNHTLFGTNRAAIGFNFYF
jgi:hypothetical protein